MSATTPTATEAASAAWRELQLARLDIAANLKEAFYCAGEAEKHGADPKEILRLLRNWAGERGLL